MAARLGEVLYWATMIAVLIIASSLTARSWEMAKAMYYCKVVASSLR
jgi:hypothetical protein